MAAGWPTKVTYANGDVFNASDINDTNGTLNYIDPTSATDNQVLTRDAAAGGKVKWANSPANTLTTTGDLYYASAANTPARLAIGTTSQVLTVVGGVPSWGSATSIDPTLMQENSGYYIRSSFSGTTFGNLHPTAGLQHFSPVYLSGSSFDQISVPANGVSTSYTVRLGLYNISLTTGKPTTVVFDAGTVNTTAGAQANITISQTIPAGWYYMSVLVTALLGGSGGLPTVTGQFYNISNTAATLNLAGASVMNGYSAAGGTGTLQTAGTLTSISSTFLVGMRIV
jgi:hypothetical protein